MVINVRLPISLLERFNRYLDRRERMSREAVSRGIVIGEWQAAMLVGE